MAVVVIITSLSLSLLSRSPREYGRYLILCYITPKVSRFETFALFLRAYQIACYCLKIISCQPSKHFLYLTLGQSETDIGKISLYIIFFFLKKNI